MYIFTDGQGTRLPLKSGAHSLLASELADAVGSVMAMV